MDKKEKKARIENHIRYWDLTDKIKEMSLNAICSELSVDDVISVLDRVKTILLQQEVIVMMEETQNETEGDDDSEDNDIAVGQPQVDIKTPVPLVDPSSLAEEATRGLYG